MYDTHMMIGIIQFGAHFVMYAGYIGIFQAMKKGAKYVQSTASEHNTEIPIACTGHPYITQTLKSINILK